MERRLRHEQVFKWAIVISTFVVVGALLRMIPWGRYLLAALKPAARQAMGMPEQRAEIDLRWRRFRLAGIEVTRSQVERFYAEANPAHQRLMRYAGMVPEHMLIRWANFDQTLVLSTGVFEADDNGRAYRLLPLVRSIWLRNVPFETGIRAFCLVPDGPGLADAIAGTTAEPLESSRQTTNSWGLRGPEPNCNAPVRGIVLGDSYMQGMLIGDGESPPERLEGVLQNLLKNRVSILNAGVMGYSPEQYYYSLIAFADRFRPQFVVINVFLNDFGGIVDVGERGRGDWQEGKYWLEKVIGYCRVRRWTYLLVPTPVAQHLLKKRNSGYYPGTLSNILNIESLKYLYPIEDFVDAHLKLRNEAARKGYELQDSPLFNGAIGDGHFSAAGSEVWAGAVGRRLVLLLNRDPDLDDRSEPVPRESKKIDALKKVDRTDNSGVAGQDKLAP
jgi:hypothetical protein